MNQLLDRYTRLPRAQRLLLVCLGYIVICAVFFVLLISPTLAEIATTDALQAELTTKRTEVRTRADNRATFEAELEGLSTQLKLALEELPNDREIPILLSEIDGHARKSGLDVSRFQPLPEVLHEYFADVPVQLVMEGSFHEIGLFFDRVATMSRIVSVENITMSDPVPSGSETNLKVTAQAVTYRFLTEKELEDLRDATKKGKQPGARGGGR